MNSGDYRPAIIIPVYNHEGAVGEIVQRLLSTGLPVLMVDDGSDAVCKNTLEALQKKHASQVNLVRLPHNQGKGAAVKAGFKWLHERQYTHGLQLDADGQHDVSDIKPFLASSESNPQSLITGYPQYDASVPKHRFYARYLTHIWVWINSLSFTIVDSMCGFRIYPITQTVSMLERSPCGNRMDFDTEVIVRWVWEGWPVINLPTKVHYPIDGVSHFKLWKDNFLITCMHTRLFFGMLVRLPRLLVRKLKRVSTS